MSTCGCTRRCDIDVGTSDINVTTSKRTKEGGSNDAIQLEHSAGAPETETGHSVDPHRVEHLDLGDSEEVEGIPVERLPLQRADDDGAGEALADSGRLGAVEVTAGAADDRLQPRQLGGVRGSERRVAARAEVLQPAQDDEVLTLNSRPSRVISSSRAALGRWA